MRHYYKELTHKNRFRLVHLLKEMPSGNFQQLSFTTIDVPGRSDDVSMGYGTRTPKQVATMIAKPEWKEIGTEEFLKRKQEMIHILDKFTHF